MSSGLQQKEDEDGCTSSNYLNMTNGYITFSKSPVRSDGVPTIANKVLLKSFFCYLLTLYYCEIKHKCFCFSITNSFLILSICNLKGKLRVFFPFNKRSKLVYLL